MWALVSARRPLPWAGAAAPALLTGYACLTTFSRGVYLAVAGSLLLLCMFPAAQSYFVPWHLDNLFLEVLVERGLAGLLLLVALMTYALW